MLNKIKNYFRGLMLSLYMTEKMTLSPNDGLSDGITKSVGINEGRLSDDLMKGILSEETRKLRWRMYKVMANSRNKQISSDSNGEAVSKDIDYTKDINKLDILQPEGQVKVCLFNREQTVSLGDIGEIKESMTKAELDGKLRTKRRVYVSREYLPKFEIENYADRVVVSENGDNLYTLDFYISRYVDIYDKRTPFLVSEIEKAKVKPRFCDMLDIKTAGFVTSNDVGAEDFLEFLYDIKSFTGVLDYKGYFILRFTGEAVINGESIIGEYVNEDLEGKYNRNEKK